MSPFIVPPTLETPHTLMHGRTVLSHSGTQHSNQDEQLSYASHVDESLSQCSAKA